MNYLIEREGLVGRITCDSAGTAGYHIGAPPDPRMQVAGKARGLSMVGTARQLVPMDLREFDLILAMDRSNYRDILSLDPQGKYHHKVKMMCSYCTKYNVQEVPDPYYGGPEGFNFVLDLLEDACTNLLQSLKN